MSKSEPINAALPTRLLILLAIKTRNQKSISRLWKPSLGIISISNLCIKIKPFENLAEAHAMHLVAQHITSIPVAKGYCAFTHKILN